MCSSNESMEVLNEIRRFRVVTCTSLVMGSPRFFGCLLRLKETAELSRLSCHLFDNRLAHTRDSRVGNEKRLSRTNEILSLLCRAGSERSEAL